MCVCERWWWWGGLILSPVLYIFNLKNAQLLRAARKNPNDKTEFFLLFANQTEDDILLREELDEVCFVNFCTSQARN